MGFGDGDSGVSKPTVMRRAGLTEEGGQWRRQQQRGLFPRSTLVMSS